MLTRTVVWILALGAGLAACDSGSLSGPAGGSAVVIGTFQAGGEPVSATPARSPSPSGPAAQAEAAARTVVVGEVTNNGRFVSLAEANVNANGEFRIDSLPSGRSELLIRARNEAEAEIGSVVLHEITVAGAEHRAHPITSRSTVHARVWTEMRASGQGSTPMESAELSLILHFSSEAAARSATSSSSIRAIADAALEAQAALTAVLASEGQARSAAARSELLLDLAVARDRERNLGIDAETAQETFVSAALDAFAADGVSAEALIFAHAAAASAFDAEMARASGDSDGRLEASRGALLLNLRSRARAALEAEGSVLGLRSAAITTVERLEARVRTAQSITELEISLAQERAAIEGRVITAVLASLVVSGGGPLLEVESELRSALDDATLWADLQGAYNTGARVQAVQAFRARVEAAAANLVATLPAEVAATVSTEVVARLMIAMGADAAIA